MERQQFYVEDLLPRLENEFGYPQSGAKLVAEKLVICDPLISGAFWEWWQTGKAKLELEIEGFSLARLMNEHQMKPIAAFLTMDWLLREPQKAATSLRRGHDNISSRT